MDAQSSHLAPMAAEDHEDPSVQASAPPQEEAHVPPLVEAPVNPPVEARAPMGFSIVTGMQTYDGMEPYMSLKVSLF